MCSERASARGFTLLELIVAITLMGLLLVVLYGGLRTGLQAWERAGVHVESTQRMRLVHAFLRRQLAQSLTTFDRDTDRRLHYQHAAQNSTVSPLEKAVAFLGEPEQIAFVAPLLSQLGQGGLYWVEVVRVEQRLLLRAQPYRTDAEHVAGTAWESVLLDNVSALEWAYFGPETPTPARSGEPSLPVSSQWTAQWQRADMRPTLVRLNLTVDGVVWPDLVVALTEADKQ